MRQVKHPPHPQINPLIISTHQIQNRSKNAKNKPFQTQNEQKFTILAPFFRQKH